MDSSNTREGGKGKKGKKSKKEKNTTKEEKVDETEETARQESQPQADQETAKDSTPAEPQSDAAAPQDASTPAPATSEVTGPGKTAANSERAPQAEAAPTQQQDPPVLEQADRSEQEKKPESKDDAASPPNALDEPAAQQAQKKEQESAPSQPSTQAEEGSSSPATTGKIRTRDNRGKKGKSGAAASPSSGGSEPSPAGTENSETPAAAVEAKPESKQQVAEPESRPSEDESKKDSAPSSSPQVEQRSGEGEPVNQKPPKSEPAAAPQPPQEPAPQGESAGSRSPRKESAAAAPTKTAAPIPETQQQEQQQQRKDASSAKEGSAAAESTNDANHFSTAAPADSSDAAAEPPTKLSYEPVPEVDSEGEEDDAETKAKKDRSGGKQVRTNEPIEAEGEHTDDSKPMTVKERRRARKVVTQLADHDPFARGSVKIAGGGQGIGIAVVREVRRNRRSVAPADADKDKKPTPAENSASEREDSKKKSGKSTPAAPTTPSATTEPIATVAGKPTSSPSHEEPETQSSEPTHVVEPAPDASSNKSKGIELEMKEIRLRVGDVLQIRWYSPEVGSIVECDRFYKPLKARSAACLLPRFHRRDRHEKEDDEKKAATPPSEQPSKETSGEGAAFPSVEKPENNTEATAKPETPSAKKATGATPSVSRSAIPANGSGNGSGPQSGGVDVPSTNNGDHKQQDGDDCDDEERFTVKFPEKGEYFFRSEDPELEGFRLKVKVSGLTHDFFRNTFKYLIGGSLILTLIIIAILIAVFVVDANVKILPRSGRSGDPSYEGAKEVQTILLRYLGSWCVLGVLILLILIFVRLGFCCWRSWCQDFGRGFTSYQQRKAQISQLVLLLPLCGVVLAYWWYFLKTNFYWNTFFRTLRVSTVNTINQVIGLTEDIDFISVQFPILFPGAFEFPPGVPTLLTQVQTLADNVKTFASDGEDLIRALFRAFVILVFIVLQIVLASVSYKLVATLKKNANLLRSGIWMMWFSLFCVCLSLGTGWIVYEVLGRAVDILGEFQGKTMTADSLQRATASSADSPIMKVFGMCLGKADFDLDFMNKALDGLKEQWNKKAAEAGIPNLVIPANIGDYTKKITGGVLNGTSGSSGGGSGGSLSGLGNTSIQNLTIDVLLNYSDVLVNQVDAMAPMFERSKISLNSTLSSFGISLGNSSALSSIQRLAPDFSRIGPTLKAAASVAKGLRGVMDCSLIRETLSDSYLVLKKSILENIFIANILLIVIFGFHVFSIFLGFGTIYVFNRKWKNWYEARSNRWFRFRCSYQAHIRVLDQTDPEEVGERVRWYRPFTRYDCLNGFYSVNMSNAFLVMLQAVLLILLHQSAEEDRLSFELQLVCFLCAAAPLVAFVTELIKWIGLRALLRFITFGLTTTGCVFASIFAAESIKKNIHCISEITGGSSKSTSNSTGFSLPFTNDCGADSSVRQIEQSVYSVLIALVCFIASITSLVLLFGVRIRQTNNKIQTAAEKKNNNCARYCANGTIGIFFLLVLAGLIVLVVFVVTNVVPAPQPPRTSINPITNDLRFCNGYPHYCSKTPLDIVWMMPHHSFSNADDSFFSPYHFLGTSTQLREGIRAFDLSVFPTPADKGATLSICRSNCDLGSYPLLRELTQLYDYMTLNTSTVMLLRFRFQSDSALPAFVSAISQANLTQFVWKGKLNGSPETNSSFVWPNLRKLLETNQRILLFTDLSTASVAASTSSAVRGASTWLLPIWEYAFETEERVRKESDFNCEMQSMSFDPAAVVAPAAIRDNQLALLHHSISVPEASAGAAATTNTRDSIISRFFNCSSAWNRRPSIVVLNYWSVGNPIVTIDEING